MKKVYAEVTITEGEEYFLDNRNCLMKITRVTEDFIFARATKDGWKEVRLYPSELVYAVKIGDSIGSKTFKVDVTPDTSYELDDEPKVDNSYELD